MSKRNLAFAVLAVTALAVTLYSNTAHAWTNGPGKITLCHQNGNGTYTEITVNKHSAAFHGNQNTSGHANHAGDVIPPFSEPFVFPGLNWTTENAALWADHKCPTPPPSTTTSQPPVTTTTEAPATTTTSPEIPTTTSTIEKPDPVPTTVGMSTVPGNERFVEIGEPASVDHNLEQPAPVVKVADVQPVELPHTGVNSGLAVAGGLALVAGLSLAGLARSRER